MIHKCRICATRFDDFSNLFLCSPDCHLEFLHELRKEQQSSLDTIDGLIQKIKHTGRNLTMSEGKSLLPLFRGFIRRHKSQKD